MLRSANHYFWGRGYLPPSNGETYNADEVKQLANRYGSMLIEPYGDSAGSLKSVDADTLNETLKEAIETLGDKSPSPAEVFTLICRTVADAEEKQVGIEKTPHHVMWRDRIDAAYPDHRMVITVRSAYGFMLSYKHQGDRKEPEVRKAFARRYHPLGCALVWRGYARQSIASRERFGERTLLVDFDDLKKEELRVTQDVQDFFGLTYHEIAGSIPKDNSSFTGEKRPELKPEDIFWMNWLASDEIEALGFEKQHIPFAPIRISYSCLRLTWWGAWNVYDLKKKTKGSFIAYLMRWIKGR